MRRVLGRLLAVAAVAAVGGCSGPSTLTPVLPVDHFTQGGVSMEPAIKAGRRSPSRQVAKDYKPTRGDIIVFHANSDKWGPDAAAGLPGSRSSRSAARPSPAVTRREGCTSTGPAWTSGT